MRKVKLRNSTRPVSPDPPNRQQGPMPPKRYNRSHVGGSSSYVPQNEFPIFSHSGDVDILVAAGAVEKRYLLHRDTLARCSGFFEASTSSPWSKAQLSHVIREDQSSSISLDDARHRWTYELQPAIGPGDVPMLVQKTDDLPVARPALPPSSLFGGSRQRPGHVSFSLSVADLSRDSTSSTLSPADEDLLRDYDNLFRIFYNYPPILDGVNVADAYIQCKSLLALADQYDALAVVGPRVDHHLLQFQSRLWRQIAKYPVSYLRLGYLARSKVIFQEALIHVVGQWPVGERSLRASLPDLVLEIIQDKVDELEETVSRIEGRLFRLSLTTPRGRAYRLLGSSNPTAFLAHEDCKRFLKLTPDLYSRDNLRRFERRLDELKALARHVVAPLLGTSLELDVVGAGRLADAVGYLTCVSVGEGDLPWEVER
ncbi:hypothetical protein GQ602_004324 [Ophiocordyceps camponoti-floridani]|uniref:BTB domain-containing protein n=1 Tax=Ophiocordyceps camponoti-floridani TaxID=2030778 RepID=A0A8H4VDG1_9HYPO|nr:hypothetical protein GQ602_004324 [Ophiocordyceps camponoti-floridani]